VLKGETDRILFGDLPYFEALSIFYIVSIGYSSFFPNVVDPSSCFLLPNLFFKLFNKSSKLDVKISADGLRPVSFSYLDDIDSVNSGKYPVLFGD
jgi:hypothetical protein